MLAQYLITFREVLEAALIMSIVLSYLARTCRLTLTRYIWYGVFSATLASIILGITIWLLYGVLSKSVQALFEGIAALIAVFVLSSMIYWMATKGKILKIEMEKQLESIANRGAILSLIFFSFVVVFREGFETVLFLTPFILTDVGLTIVGLLLGLLTSLALSYGIFRFGMKINIRKFFYFTSILLVILAGGLVGYGMHEIVEATGTSLWGWFGQPAYDLMIPSDSLLHHKGIVGSIFSVMFGYTVKAEWVRVIAHLLYLSFMLPLVIMIYKKK